MPKKAAPKINEKELSKGHLRKLTALRKSLGQEIADKAFIEWFESQDIQSGAPSDKNADLIAATLEPLITSNELKIRKGGYLVKRGRGRVIVEPATG